MTPQTVNAAHRATTRIKARLEELGMTGREFARQLNDHKDAWMSNLLAGKFALSLTELDKAAAILRVPPGELVRDAEEGWDLAPTERRLVRALRLLPPPVRDHLVILADYLVGVTPEEVDLLHDIRRLTGAELDRLQHYVRVIRLTQGSARETAAHQDPPATTVRPTETTPRAAKRRRA